MSFGDLTLHCQLATFALTFLKKRTHNATFTLCPRRPRQSRFRPPWTKRGDRNTTQGNWIDKKVAPPSCRNHRDRFLNSQEVCHGSHGGIDLLKCAVVEWGNATKRDRTQHTLEYVRSGTGCYGTATQGLSRSVKVYQVLLRSATFCLPNPPAET